jgi:hypothetical protein
MLITSNYNPISRTEKAWYESSNIFYSEFVEDADKNEGDLFVTFTNGATYKYKKVQIAPDYLMFKHGGLEGSHGKALNAHIKPKYEFEKMESKNVQELTNEREQTILQQKEDRYNKTFFISGHRNITEEQFEVYKTKITQISNDTPDALFVIGDYNGVDIMAQNFLVDELGIDPSRVTVYHMLETPRNIHPAITNTVGGFETDEERDAAMTAASSRDIAFVQDHTKWSGTAQNILRRYLL